MSNIENTKEFLSIEEFAEKISKHPSSVRRAIKSNRINAVRIGNGKKASYRIHISEINRIGFFDFEDMVNSIIEKKLKEKDEG